MNYNYGPNMQGMSGGSPQGGLSGSPNEMMFSALHAANGNQGQQQTHPQAQAQGLNVNVNPAVLLRRPTADQQNFGPLDMDSLYQYMPSASSPLGTGSSPLDHSLELVGTPTSDIEDQWEATSQNEMGDFRNVPVNLSGSASGRMGMSLNTFPNNLGTVSPNTSSLLQSGYMMPSEQQTSLTSGNLSVNALGSGASAPRPRAGSNASQISQSNENLLSAPPMPTTRLRRSKSDTASTTRARSRSRADPMYAGQQAVPGSNTSGDGSGVTSPTGTPITEQFDENGRPILFDLDAKRRQIEKKSREKRNASLDKLKLIMKDLTGHNFTDRSQSEVFDNAANLLK